MKRFVWAIVVAGCASEPRSPIAGPPEPHMPPLEYASKVGPAPNDARTLGERVSTATIQPGPEYPKCVIGT